MTSLDLGFIPRSIWATLEDDLINACKPGDDVKVVGIVSRRWQPFGRGVDGRTDISLALKAIHITVVNDQKSSMMNLDDHEQFFKNFWKEHRYEPLRARNQILASFCPQVYGLYAIKLALAVVLCGGVEREDETGTKVRGEPHLVSNLSACLSEI